MSDADTAALVAMLRQIQCEPASFDTYSMASAAERAADAIERLQLSAIDDQEMCRRGDEIILELEKTLDAARSSLTASEKDAARYRWLRDKADPADCDIYLASDSAFVSFRAAAVDASIDAAMEKANG